MPFGELATRLFRVGDLGRRGSFYLQDYLRLPIARLSQFIDLALQPPASQEGQHGQQEQPGSRANIERS